MFMTRRDNAHVVGHLLRQAGIRSLSALKWNLLARERMLATAVGCHAPELDNLYEDRHPSGLKPGTGQ